MEMTREQITQAMLENMKPWPSTNENATKGGAASRPAAVVQTSGIVPAKGETMSEHRIIVEYHKRIKEIMVQEQCTRQEANVLLCREDPSLHEGYVRQTNVELRARRARR